MGVKSLKRVCKLGIFSVILTFVKATIDGNKLLIFAYWPCIENQFVDLQTLTKTLLIKPFEIANFKACLHGFENKFEHGRIF